MVLGDVSSLYLIYSQLGLVNENYRNQYQGEDKGREKKRIPDLNFFFLGDICLELNMNLAQNTC